MAETLAFCASVPDVELYACPVTTHVAVPWFHTTQLQRATKAGVAAPIAEGPQPFCKYSWSGDSYIEHFDVGSAELYHGFGNTISDMHTADFAMPASMIDLYDDSVTWDYIHDWADSCFTEIRRVQKGYSFTPSNIMGGSKGLDVSLNTQRKRYRKCVWQNVKGVPHPVEVELPTDRTNQQYCTHH